MSTRVKEPKAVFLTGAGLSADSGVPTYRGEGGIYNGMRAEKVMSAWTMKHNPDVIYRFCDDRRVELDGVRPNAAHMVIEELASEFGERIVHLTQNIDGLCPGAIELHGRLTRMRSIGNSHVTTDIGFTRYWDGDPERECPGGFRFRCPKTNSHFRPDVVLFDEPAPAYSKLWKVVRSLRRWDVLVVIGTQGSVLPVEDFARGAPCLTVLNNLHESADIDEDAFDIVLRKRAAEAAAEIGEIVRKRLGMTAGIDRSEDADLPGKPAMDLA